MHFFVNRIDLGCLTENLTCEFIPGAKSLIGRMVSAIFVCLHHIHQQSCQVIGIGRRTDLIIHNRQFIMCFTEVQHGLDKVLSVHTEYPGNADNVISGQVFLNRQFTLIFCLAVYIQRMTLVIRLPRTGALSVKHVIRTDIDHLQIQLRTDFCDILRTTGIDLAHFFNLILILCQIHSRPCRTVNDCLHVGFPDHTLHRSRICDIHLLNVHTDTGMTPFRQFIHHIMAKLSFDTCHQYSHVIHLHFVFQICLQVSAFLLYSQDAPPHDQYSFSIYLPFRTSIR